MQAGTFAETPVSGSIDAGRPSLAGFVGWIDFLAILSLAAYANQANAFVMALVSALFLVPAMLLGPRVGRWLDRSNPGALILAALALCTLATALLMLQPSR